MSDTIASLKANGYQLGRDGIYRRPDSDRPAHAAPVAIPAAIQLAKTRAKLTAARRSPLAVKFEALWAQLGGPHLTPEHRICKDRKWRADYAHLTASVIVELEGGIHSGGRHTRAGGFLKDCEKYNRCSSEGWMLYRLGTGMITEANVEPIIGCIRRRLATP